VVGTAVVVDIWRSAGVRDSGWAAIGRAAAPATRRRQVRQIMVLAQEMCEWYVR
jgi:hypothetical protein